MKNKTKYLESDPEKYYVNKSYLDEINKDFKDWLFKNHQGIYDIFKNDPNIHGTRLVYVMLANEVWEHLERQIEGMKNCENCKYDPGQFYCAMGGYSRLDGHCEEWEFQGN